MNHQSEVAVSGSLFIEKIVHAYQTTTTEVNTSTTTITDIKISTPLIPITEEETTSNKTGFLIQPISFLLIAITIFIRRRKGL